MTIVSEDIYIHDFSSRHKEDKGIEAINRKIKVKTLNDCKTETEARRRKRSLIQYYFILRIYTDGLGGPVKSLLLE